MLRAALLAARLQPAMMAPGISIEDVSKVSGHPTCRGSNTAADSVGRRRLNAERSHYKPQQVAMEEDEVALCCVYCVCMCVNTCMLSCLPACLPGWSAAGPACPQDPGFTSTTEPATCTGTVSGDTCLANCSQGLSGSFGLPAAAICSTEGQWYVYRDDCAKRECGAPADTWGAGRRALNSAPGVQYLVEHHII